MRDGFSSNRPYTQYELPTLISTTAGINKFELHAFCDRLLHSVLQCCHPALAVDSKHFTVSEWDTDTAPHPAECQRLPLVLHVLCCLALDLFIGPTLFSRSMRLASIFLDGSESADMIHAINASACAVTMLSVLKVIP